MRVSPAGIVSASASIVSTSDAARADSGPGPSSPPAPGVVSTSVASSETVDLGVAAVRVLDGAHDGLGLLAPREHAEVARTRGDDGRVEAASTSMHAGAALVGREPDVDRGARERRPQLRCGVLGMLLLEDRGGAGDVRGRHRGAAHR